MDTSEPIAVAPAKRGWRRHGDEFKARVIGLAQEPGASVAAVALANGLNANMLRRWVREAADEARAPNRPTAKPSAMPPFLPLPMPQPTAAKSVQTSTFIEVHRGETSIYVTLACDIDSAAWVREVLG